VTVVDKIRWQALQSGVSPALSLPGKGRYLVSYIRLVGYVDNASARLAAEGLKAGDVLGLQVRDSLLHIVLTLAAEQLGLSTVSLPNEVPVVELPLAAIICDHQPVSTGIRFIQADHQWLAGATFDNAKNYCGNDNTIRRILLTSGSTGRKKAIALTDRMVEERVNSYKYVFGPRFSLQRRILCCMGFGSSLGYLFLMYALQNGCMYCIPDTSIAVTAHKAAVNNVGAIIASPGTFADLWGYFHDDGKNLPQLQLVLTAGSQLSEQLATRIRRDICTDLVIFYGTTETGVVASAQAEMLDLGIGEVGFLAPGIELETREENGNVISDAPGRICIRSSANATAYINDAEESELKFQDGWFFPGDIGAVDSGRILSMKGRETGVVNLGGHKTTIESIEKVWAEAPSVVEAAAVLETNELGLDQVAATVITTEGWTEAGFLEYVKAHIDRPCWPSRVISLKSMPRLPNGKLDRAALHGLALNRSMQ
jgi:acyl-coenzyme A synthetase/AMP-(fatty) acid ligase